MDKIWIYGIACRAKVGVPAAERRKPQLIHIDVGLEFDTSLAAVRDDFRQTADYWAVEKTVRKIAETGERQLIETLAEKVAEGVLRLEMRTPTVTVIVHKKPAVMPRTREVAVEIVRRSR